ncbi:fimbrial protein [Morganella morganii]|nr:type 1 fimbrial protein [Morganella morganii]
MFLLRKNSLYLLVFFASATYAADVVFNITGKIEESACEIIVGNGQTVSLGFFSTGYLQSVGDITPMKPFSITLDNCPDNYNDVQVTFEGDAVPGNPQLLKLQSGGAQNVGIAIYDSDKTTLIPLNTASSGKSVTTTEETALTFYAAYMSTGTVTEGVANADVSFTVSYH